MRYVCYICGLLYRVQPPFKEDDISHGLCDHCFPAEMEKIKEESAAFHGEKRKGRSPSYGYFSLAQNR